MEGYVECGWMFDGLEKYTRPCRLPSQGDGRPCRSHEAGILPYWGGQGSFHLDPVWRRWMKGNLPGVDMSWYHPPGAYSPEELAERRRARWEEFGLDPDEEERRWRGIYNERGVRYEDLGIDPPAEYAAAAPPAEAAPAETEQLAFAGMPSGG